MAVGVTSPVGTERVVVRSNLSILSASGHDLFILFVDIDGLFDVIPLETVQFEERYVVYLVVTVYLVLKFYNVAPLLLCTVNVGHHVRNLRVDVVQFDVKVINGFSRLYRALVDPCKEVIQDLQSIVIRVVNRAAPLIQFCGAKGARILRLFVLVPKSEWILEQPVLHVLQLCRKRGQFKVEGQVAGVGEDEADIINKGSGEHCRYVFEGIIGGDTEPFLGTVREDNDGVNNLELISDLLGDILLVLVVLINNVFRIQLSRIRAWREKEDKAFSESIAGTMDPRARRGAEASSYATLFAAFYLEPETKAKLLSVDGVSSSIATAINECEKDREPRFVYYDYLTADGFVLGRMDWSLLNQDGWGFIINEVEGSSYVGGVKNKVPHGHGSMIYPDKSTYVGRFWYGIRHGLGKGPREGVYINNDFANNGVVVELRVYSGHRVVKFQKVPLKKYDSLQAHVRNIATMMEWKAKDAFLVTC